MALTDTEAVRLKTGDKSILERKKFVGNGVDKIYDLSHQPIIQSTPPVVTLAGAPQTEVTHYTVDYANGVITFVATPAANAEIIVRYYWSVFSDAEVEHFLGESNDNANLASARLLLAMAADAARIAKKETLSGGGGSGTRTIDTSVAARELRETAKSFIEIYQTEEGSSYPAEGLTEVPWTEFTKETMSIQDWIRES
jgi:hypothetical protein